MNPAHWHLVLNHFPIIGVVIGTLILIGGFIFKNNSVIKQVAAVLFVLCSVSNIAAYFSGENAEDIVEKIPGIYKILIEEHEDMGKIFLAFSLLTGLLSAISIIVEIRTGKGKFLYTVVLFLALITSGIGIKTGSTGGKIRHSEIRNDNNTTFQQNGGDTENSGEKDDD